MKKEPLYYLKKRKVQPQYKAIGLLVGMGLFINDGMAVMAEQPSVSSSDNTSWLRLAEGGEGGEGGGALSIDQRVQFLTNLGLIQGHLLAAVTLRIKNLKELAVTHAKHPSSELYQYLDFTTNNVPEFDKELSKFSEGLSGNISLDEVKGLHEALSARIKAIYDTMPNDPALWGQAIHQLVRTAAEEFRIGVVDGKMNNLHEYQDSWGFVKIAQSFNRKLLDSSKAEVRKIGKKIKRHLETLSKAQPTVMPDSEAKLAEVSLFYSTAAMVELATLGL